jgi:hypothetical protein
MSILSVDTIQPIGSGSTVTLNAAKIVVGTGITFESNGQAIYAGIITATSFSGSGANLTSLPAQATIANNADNRVITGGSGVNLNGESTFTYDGTSVATIDTSQTYATFRLDGSAGGAIEFYENGTRRFELYGTDPEVALYDRDKGAYHTRFKAGGNVEISDGNLIVASGHGIDFSATGNLSGTQSELLDDYEEGTWTPEINGGYSSISYHNPRIGYYTKVGNHVSFQIYLYVYQATGAAANVQITLPFTSLSNSGRETGAYTAYSNGFMSNSWNEKSGCGYLIGGNYSYLRPCKLTNGAIIYGNDTRLGAGANNQYLIICGQMFAA